MRHFLTTVRLQRVSFELPISWNTCPCVCVCLPVVLSLKQRREIRCTDVLSLTWSLVCPGIIVERTACWCRWSPLCKNSGNLLMSNVCCKIRHCLWCLSSLSVVVSNIRPRLPDHHYCQCAIVSGDERIRTLKR